MTHISEHSTELRKEAFGPDFTWGVSVAAYQIEGAHAADEKGPSVWDVFTRQKGKIYQNQNGNVACDFYHRYRDDLRLMQQLNIPNFRFSLAWPRIMPNGRSPVNPKGIQYYNRLIDYCLELGIEPWVTLYHWDLPYALEEKGGWTNRDIVGWFEEYVQVCARSFGDRVRHWMILNEPMVFTGAGYFLGIHAPGKRWMKNFIPAMHHAALSQAGGGRVLKHFLPSAQVGTTFSASYIEPARSNTRDLNAARRIDALLNRLYLEPALGMGYPLSDLPFLKRVEKYWQPNDDTLLPFDFDFIGLQVYTREIVSHSWLMPFVNAGLVKAPKRNVPITLMDWEVFPPSIFHLLQQYGKYPNIRKILVTENGSAFTDQVQNGKVHDPDRLNYLRDHIWQVLRARKMGVPVEGYFVWTFTDNFEWAMGYRPRFGLVHVDFSTQRRIVKSSGYWYRDFLAAD